MNSHNLSLEIVETSNEKILKIIDLSVYNPLLDTSCPELLVTGPGFQVSASVAQERLLGGFSLSLTACDLEFQIHKCDSVMNTLPDGVYAIRYSHQPREYVFVEYNHLRVSKLRNRIAKIYCELDVSSCMPDKDKSEILSRLTTINGMIDAAKAKIEFCHDLDKGMAIYNYVLKLVDKLDCKTCK